MNRLVAHLAGWGGLLLFTLGFAVTTASAATKVKRSRADAEAVQEALRCEVRGADAERNELLQSILKREPECAPALWHSGYVQEDSRWVKFDELARLAPEDAPLADRLSSGR